MNEFWVLCQVFICPSVSLWKDFVTSVQEAVTKHYRYVAEVKMKAKFEGRCGPTHAYRILM